MTDTRDAIRGELRDDLEYLLALFDREVEVTDEELTALFEAYEQDVSLDARLDSLSEYFVTAELAAMFLERHDLACSFPPEWADDVGGLGELADLPVSEEVLAETERFLEAGFGDAPEGYADLLERLTAIVDDAPDPEESPNVGQFACTLREPRPDFLHISWI